MILSRIQRWWINRSRAIFKFWDGQTLRKADPLAIFRSLKTDGQFDLDRDFNLIKRDDPEALDNTIAAVQLAFGVKPFDQGGLTQGECIALLCQFLEYLDAVKKNTSPPPTSPALTVPQFSGESTTKPASDCSSTSKEQSCDVPPACTPLSPAL